LKRVRAGLIRRSPVAICHLGQLFVQLGEFTDFELAFYHSVVNFTSLGYGDIIMSEKWRLLGALEAANGILMFGLTTGALLSVMTRLLRTRVGGDVG